MRKSLYLRLALSNLRKQRRLMLPYLLAAACAVMMFYILMALSRDPAILSMEYSRDVLLILNLGCIVVGIFSLLLLFYASGLLTRQRRREFGLYSVLGMEKRHIVRLFLWETLLTAAASILAGILCGVLFSKLMQLLLLRLMGLSADFAFSIDGTAILSSLALYGAIFFLIALNTARIVHASNPVELLRSGNSGEKEPRSNIPAALLGLLCLGAGYGLALKVNDIYGAAQWFFVAVLLVIAGTYLCFTAFSIVLLKALRRRKHYYYKINHFATVSGMLYRMKRNAAGLASICILSTMALVTISTTVCLYLGADSFNKSRYPYDISMVGWLSFEEDRALFDGRAGIMEEVVAEQGLTMEDYACYDELRFTVLREGDALLLPENGAGISPDLYEETAKDSRLCDLVLLTAEGYSQISGTPVSLAADEALCYTGGVPFGSEVTMLDRTWSVRTLEEAPLPEEGANGIPVCFLVVDSEETLREIQSQQEEIYFNYVRTVATHLRFNLSGTMDEQARCAEALVEATRDPEYGYSTINNNIANRLNTYATFGAFLFIGILLGALFALITVLIIYYKQVSEGFDDQARYSIMQKVGMTKGEIRRTVRSQVVTVFFLPLCTAAVHIAFAFPMVKKILALFELTDAALFLRCTLGTFGGFAVLYVAVYLLTARAYYRIVSTAGENGQ